MRRRKRLCLLSGGVVTSDRAGVQPRPQPSPRSQTFACSLTAMRIAVCRFNGLHHRRPNPCMQIHGLLLLYLPRSEGRLSLPTWLIVGRALLPTKWSPVNHRSGAGKRRRPKTDVLTTELL